MSTASPDIVITGWGAVTPLGQRAERSLARALASGDGAIGPISGIDAAADALAAQVPAPWPEALLEGGGNLRPLDRTGRLSCAAAGLALAGAGLDRAGRGDTEIGLVLGTLFGGLRTIAEFDRRALTDGPLYASPLDFANSVINAAAGQTAIWHRLTGPNATVAGGATAALQAVAWACDALAQADDGPLLAGGAEELSPEALRGFGAAGRLGTVDTAGMHLGEGAGFMVLETAQRAAARGAVARGRVRGFAGCFDHRQGRVAEAAVDCLCRAIDDALAAAGTCADAIGVVALGANGDRTGDSIERAALERVFPPGRARPQLVATKTALGEAFGAAGALQSIAALEILRGDPVPSLERPWEDWRGRPLEREGDLALIVARASDGAAWALVLGGAA